jgi:hypothetical protein
MADIFTTLGLEQRPPDENVLFFSVHPDPLPGERQHSSEGEGTITGAAAKSQAQKGE